MFSLHGHLTVHTFIFIQMYVKKCTGLAIISSGLLVNYVNTKKREFKKNFRLLIFISISRYLKGLNYIVRSVQKHLFYSNYYYYYYYYT